MNFKLEKLLYLPFILLLLLGFLDFFIKDYKDYYDYDLNYKTYIIIFIIILISTALFVYYNSSETDKFIKSAKGFAYGVFFGLISTLFISSIKNQTGFYLNTLRAKETIKSDFEISYRAVDDGKNIVGLQSVSDEFRFMTENKFSFDDLLKIQKRDTVTIQYHIGLLDQPFLPFGEIRILD